MVLRHCKTIYIHINPTPLKRCNITSAIMSNIWSVKKLKKINTHLFVNISAALSIKFDWELLPCKRIPYHIFALGTMQNMGNWHDLPLKVNSIISDCINMEQWYRNILIFKSISLHKCFTKQISMVSCQKGPTCHAYAWQIGPFW